MYRHNRCTFSPALALDLVAKDYSCLQQNNKYNFYIPPVVISDVFLCFTR